MKIVLAIDSLKGSLTSMEAARAAKEGILKAAAAKETKAEAAVKNRMVANVETETEIKEGTVTESRATAKEAEKTNTLEIVIKPLADGGEGTTEALTEGLGGRLVEQTVTGPMGTPVRATYGILEGDAKKGTVKTAVLEMAQAAGITLVKREERNPWRASTVGVGELILDAIGQGCRNFIIGIGGSATTEGGIGMLYALGYRFYNKEGIELPPVLESLGKMETIRAERLPAELPDCQFQIACDVTNPLCGENGAVYVYGPQKGVKAEEREQIDMLLRHYAEKTAKATGQDYSQTPGAGAAGGLGFAFLSFLPNVELKSGIDLVLEAVGLEKELPDTDIVITGEGQLDGQTAMGKVPIGVARLAKQYGCRVLAFAGGVTEDAAACNAAGIDAFFPIVRGVTTLEEAMEPERARRNMSAAVEQVFRLLL